MEIHGDVVRIKKEKYEEYKYLHDNIWPEIVTLIRKAHVENFTIFQKDGYLFKYFEYTGQNYDEDMRKLAADPLNQEWLSHTDACQERIDGLPGGELWLPMETIIHF